MTVCTACATHRASSATLTSAPLAAFSGSLPAKCVSGPWFGHCARQPTSERAGSVGQRRTWIFIFIVL